jgi:glycosyltransferase involved in cell wall biosynthesis
MRIVITRRARLDVPDGVNIFIFALSAELVRLGHEVTVLATEIGDPSRIEAALAPSILPEIASVTKRSEALSYDGLSLGWLTNGRQVLRRLRPDLVINNGALPFASGAPVTLAVSHDLGWDTARRRFASLRAAYKRFSYGRATRIVAVARELRSALSRELGFDPSAIAVIPPCVELAGYRSEPLERREELVVHPGTAAYKNPTATIRAFARIRSSTARLVIVGDVTDSVRSELSELRTDVRSRIELPGELPAVTLRDLLSRARLATYPTLYSVPTASATVIEAIASGTPILASTLVSADLARPGVNAHACRADRPDEASAVMDRVLEDPVEWNALSNGAMHVAGEFSAQHVAARYLSLHAGL